MLVSDTVQIIRGFLVYLTKKWAIYTAFFASILTPLYVHAAEGVAFGLDDLIDDSVSILVMAVVSLLGGSVGAMVRTEVDEFINHPAIMKILAGFLTGVVVGMAIYKGKGIGVYLTLPVSLGLSFLGGPILVFFSRWFCNRKTREAIEQKLNDWAKIDPKKD